MTSILLTGLTLPFLGTALGSLCVFFIREKIADRLQRVLFGFSSGVMVAASIWSLLIPALEASAPLGRLAFLPAAVGCSLGFALLLLLDDVVPHLHPDATVPEGPHAKLRRTSLLCLAVTLHNFPEGMAVGAVLAGFLSPELDVTFSAALALSLGIAIQNVPEGAIVSMPLAGANHNRRRAFLYGVLSGAVEPLAAILTLLLAEHLLPILPYLLSLSAGAMLYVVVEELIPEASKGPHTNRPTIAFAFGFILMMILDVALGEP